MIVLLLASRSDERHVHEFWMHLASLRRQVAGVTWATVYVEGMQEAQALVPVQAEEYWVIGCLSHTFLSTVLDSAAVWEMIDGASRKIPFIVSPCAWNEWPSPFAGKVPFADKALCEVGRRQQDSILVECVRRLCDVMSEGA
jgi:hypothetical protein